jgi:exo-beta-1,3-glucanase (GH17 family)
MKPAASTHRIPQLAADLGLNVTAGAWIDVDKAINEAGDHQPHRHLAHEVGGVNQLIVGNEYILFRSLGEGDKTDGEKAADKQLLISYIRRVKASTELPVSTAEQFHIWLDDIKPKDGIPDNADLANEVDYIAVHILPYLERRAGRTSRRGNAGAS